MTGWLRDVNDGMERNPEDISKNFRRRNERE